MVRIASLDILLSTVEDRLWGQKLSKDTANRPNIWKTEHEGKKELLEGAFQTHSSQSNILPMALV